MGPLESPCDRQLGFCIQWIGEQPRFLSREAEFFFHRFNRAPIARSAVTPMKAMPSPAIGARPVAAPGRALICNGFTHTCWLDSAADRIADISRTDLQIMLRRLGRA